MLKRILWIAILTLALAACGSATGGKATKAAQPRYHKGYYKNHVYFKHYRVGRIHLKLFEKQGTKTVKKKSV